jgi:Spy/CpxP family protein refolding chaperone
MNTLRKSIIIGMAVLGLGGSALAVQAQEVQGHAAKHAQMHAKWGERAAKREQKLHDTLKLTPAQEASWSTYRAAIKPAARAERGARADWKALPAPERMAKRIDMAKEHLAVMESQLGATTTFYGTLTPEQKKLFDANSMQRGGRHMKHRMHS